jgi:hypothetical protein
MASYDTVENADIYFANRLYVSAWTTANTSNKTKALEEATQRIDRLQFRGSKVDEDQDLDFPRYYGDEADGTEVIPDDIKIACFEVALSLLDGMNPEQEFMGLIVTRESFSKVSASYDRGLALEHLASGIPSLLAWSYLKPYLAYGKSVILHRVT